MQGSQTSPSPVSTSAESQAALEGAAGPVPSAVAVELPARRDRSIDVARMLAAFLIVTYHAAAAYYVVGGPPIAGYEPWVVVGNLSLWGRVPFFFFLSGYLAAYSLGKPGSEAGSFIGKRFKALGIPYLFWNAVCLGMLIITLKGGATYKSESMPDFLSGLAQLTGVGAEPANGPLWFVRDLLLASCLAPLLKKFGPWILVPCVTLILLPETSTDYPKPSSFGYFGIGMLLSYIPKGTLTKLFPSYGLGFLLCLGMGIVHAIWALPVSLFAGVSVGALGILLAGCYINQSWPRTADFISRHANASFLIFVAHVPVFSAGRYFYRNMANPPQGLLFFGVLAVLFTVAALIGHHVLKERFPSILKIVSGGR